MDRIGTLLKSWAHQRNEDDFVDRLHYKVTAMILTSCAFMIFAKEYGGNPIRCWGQAQWPGSWVEYSHDICFVENTYFVPNDTPFSVAKRENRKEEINYYQWLPFFLLAQAILYNLPSLFWRGLNWTSAVVTMASNAVSSLELDHDSKSRLANFIHNTIKHRSFKKHRDQSILRRWICLMDRLQLSFRLTMLYYTKKVLFLLTSVCQLILLSKFLGRSSSLWGFHTLNMLRNGETWQDTGIFPRTVMCDFQKQADVVDTYTVQCVLMANMINEKIFMGLWCWICILLCISVVNLMQWWSSLSKTSNRVDYVQKSVLSGWAVHKSDEVRPRLEEVVDFSDFLTIDGVLLFRLMEINSSCLISNDVMYQVYRTQQGLCEKEDKKSAEDTNKQDTT